MKVTVLCPHLRIAGGVRAILTYADRLARRAHDVEVVVPARHRHTAVWRSVTAAGPTWIPGFSPRVRWVSAWRADRLRRADVLVATAWQSAAVAAAAPPGAGAKFYLVQHYESLHHGRPDAVDATYRLPLRKIVISTWLRDIMRERFASDAPVLVTPVDPALFHPVDAGVPTSRPRVLMLHHSYAWKGVADGLDAVARVTPRVSGLTLVGFGVKPPRDREAYDEFHVNPEQQRLAALYSSADIYLCPSWDEGLGMPSMEAMACGAALVTYDNGGSRDYARDGETALVARRRDVADLARKLERLASDEPLRNKIAAAGQAHVTSAYDWDRAAIQMETLFEQGRAGA
ncbi:MAG: glycosyltransferase family 4 protein [Candidatus Rokubacteria bacterium]|nr:glycosyltransferase family 4 protein [Candidatus Rokubacteria bacterium]